MNSAIDSATGSPIETLSPSSSGQPTKRRKVTSTSSRGVASLTPEQLAKKRANDRDAQRAIRERTRVQIETLERRIQELTAQQPYQELQAVLRQKDAVQAENDEIRKRLASVLSLIQPIVGAQSLKDLATAAQSNLPGASSSGSSRNYAAHLSHDQDGRSGLHGPEAYSDATSVTIPTLSHNASSGSSTEGHWPNVTDAFNYQRNNLEHGLELNESGEKLGFNFLLDGTQQFNKVKQLQQGHQQHQPSPNPPIYPPISNPQTYADNSIAPWAAPCRNIPPTCPLDGILLDFLYARQREAADGVPRENLVGPRYPSVSSLLNPEKSKDSHPLSQVFTDILSKFPDISALPEQVASLYFMFLLMRWQIYPTQENYERLPEWMTPRPSQLFIPHPAWIDYLPWPRMRDKLVSCYEDYPFENWFIPYTATISINWPYEPTDALLSSSSTGNSNNSNEAGELVINPVFERHMRRLENWSLGEAFAKAHPAMVETAKIIKDNRRGESSDTNLVIGGLAQA